MSSIFLHTAGLLTFEDKPYRCAIGKNGFAQGERSEGSATTPVGEFALRECWYRADKLAIPPLTILPLRKIQPDDGWCDASVHPLYNRHVKLPFEASHEQLWRSDDVYDLIIPIGFNDDPVVAGRGSAIFIHIAQPDYSPTEGCIALNCDDLLALLADITPETTLLIAPTR